jgi:hypothetical protein
MRNYQHGFIAVLIAIACVSFFKHPYSDGGFCNESLYWFKVNVLNKTCNQIISQSQLDPIVDFDGDGVLTSFDYNPIPASSHPYACQDIDNTACALGYRKTNNHLTNQIETFIEFGEIKYRPIANQVTSYRCCIKGPPE